MEQKEIRRQRALDMTVCNKCGCKSSYVLRKLDAYCAKCFIASFTRKVRMDIGKHRLIKQKEKVLLAFSGGNRSSCLVAFVHELMACKKRPFRVQPVVIHIDAYSLAETLESAIVPRRFGLGTLEQLQKAAFHFKFEVNFYALEDIFASSFEYAVEERGKTTEQLLELFSSLGSLSAKEEMLRLLRRDLLLKIAVHLSSEKIIVGDCATQLAMHCLTLVSRGRGSAIANLTDFASQYGNIHILKPFRFVSAKEIALYNLSRDVPVAGRTSLTSLNPFNSSFERLTEHFIAGLESDFPSTTASVMRTAQKLRPEDTDAVIEQCIICGSDIEPRDLNIFANHHKDIMIPVIAEEHSSSCCETEQQPLKDTDTANLIHFACYGCRNLLQQADPLRFSLPHIQPRLVHRMSREKMRADVQEFLLSDDGSNDEG